ncbi:MAG: TetR family transcriptional regulator [Terracidiphilus sp.]|jgi:AcrR family transcriptional regulator
MIVWSGIERKMIRQVVAERPYETLHKQGRAMRTREQLLRAARAVFARDGFEHARIEEIASKAGKTRGAFYDNFNDKEDVFFAIFEENINRGLAELKPLLARLISQEQRIEALVKFLRGLTRDRERMLLSLEFKLYSIRHPRKRKRLAALYGVMKLRGSIPELNMLLPHVKGRTANAQLCDSLAICGLLDGLALSHFFNPETFNDRELGRYLKIYLRQTLSWCPDEKAQKKK